LGLIAFSSPFDDTAVDFLEELNVPCYKVASFEMTDLNLVKKVASTGKPMIISTGMATIAEIAETVETARAAGCEELVLLKCTSTYPASPEDTNLATIPLMRETFGCEVGLSDHTMGIGVPIASVALGASVIEKHFTLRRADGGVDSAFSIEPEELKQLVTEVERASLAVGKAKIGPSKREEKSKQFRRSIYVTKDVTAGEVISPENIRVVRPGFGLESKYLNFVEGLLFSRDVKAGTRLNWDILKNESKEYSN
jgi:pseudaminic acid synthase